jgi:hypothetical protein
MAIFVMAVITVLNIVLLLLVLRIGTQGEHHSEFTAEQSTAVMTLRAKLGISSSASSDDSSAGESDSE